MRRLNVFGFYSLASKLQPLTVLADTATVSSIWWVLWEARDEIKNLLANQVVPVRTCRALAQRLVDAITAVVPGEWKEFSESWDSVKDQEVLSYVLSNIRNAAKALETVLAEELSLLDTYSVTKKGAYQMSDLIGAAEMLLPESIRGHLPDTAVVDIQQAGRCFAFETPTAAGFHIFRAVETVMLEYYQVVTGKAKPSKGRNWGNYIKTMRTSEKADPKILDALDHLRENYRNPVTHPETTLSLEDIQVLLGLAVSVMTLMLQAISVPIASQSPK